MQFFKIATLSDLAPGRAKAFEVNGKTIAVFNVDGQFYAIDDACPHRGASLAASIAKNGKVFCSWHLFDFDLKTGACGAIPDFPVQTYELKVEGTEIFVLC
ncbi:MAG: Rieske 2Fe-2S domain-containing protein [Acidobacteria bacterium]|nr:Rieske 2Fe-2S domain-containing protein [Acidobacteriota bacterium]